MPPYIVTPLHCKPRDSAPALHNWTRAVHFPISPFHNRYRKMPVTTMSASPLGTAVPFFTGVVSERRVIWAEERSRTSQSARDRFLVQVDSDRFRRGLFEHVVLPPMG